MKDIIKNTIFKFCYYLGIFYLFRFLNRNKAIILIYHGVTSRIVKGIENNGGHHTKVKIFEEQMKYLCKYYKIISMDSLIDQLKNKNIKPYSVVVTFDDGYKNNYTNAFPILNKYNIPATIFCSTNFINKQELFWWNKLEHAINNTKIKKLELKIDENLYIIDLTNTKNKISAYINISYMLTKMNEVEKNKILTKFLQILCPPANTSENIDYLTLSWREIQKMKNKGISFGAHTSSHIILTKAPIDQAKEEIVSSKQKMEEKIGEQISCFSYPNGGIGDFNEDIKQILKDAHFLCAVTTISGMNDIYSDLYELKRLSCGNNVNCFCFSAIISGFITWAKRNRMGYFLGKFLRS